MKKLIFILMVGGLLAQEESQIIKNKYQITASTTLENLAIDEKSERELIGGGLLAGSGVLFSLPLIIPFGDPAPVLALGVSGVIVGGIGILLRFIIKSKVEKKYDSIKDIDNEDEKEELAYNHLVYLADKAKRERQYKIATYGAISAYSFIDGTVIRRDEWRNEKNSASPLYSGLLNGTLALYHYKVLSKEEQALENFRTQP